MMSRFAPHQTDQKVMQRCGIGRGKNERLAGKAIGPCKSPEKLQGVLKMFDYFTRDHDIRAFLKLINQASWIRNIAAPDRRVRSRAKPVGGDLRRVIDSI